MDTHGADQGATERGLAVSHEGSLTGTSRALMFSPHNGRHTAFCAKF